MKTYSKIGLAFLAGAAAGVVAGILFAPASGSDTRRKMGNKAREFTDDLKEKASEGWQFTKNTIRREEKEFVD